MVGMDGCVSTTGELFVSVPRGNNERLCFAVTIISGHGVPTLLSGTPAKSAPNRTFLLVMKNLGSMLHFISSFQRIFLLFDSNQSLLVTFSLESIHAVSENEFLISPQPKIAQAKT